MCSDTCIGGKRMSEVAHTNGYRATIWFSCGKGTLIEEELRIVWDEGK